ncbi:MAG: glycosyltransferase family 9 protein [Bacteroidetes bacterium]|nr:glycosyltransferase family 9 protein [Bacteroidota bacterium]
MNQIRLLITRIDRIGDVVLSTPIPREVKRKYPKSFVAVLVRDYTKDIYENNPYVDEIIVYNKDENDFSFWQMMKRLRKYKFNHAFMLLPDERLNWLLFFSSIKNRIGVGHKFYQFISFTKYINRRKYIPLRHEADYCLDMIRKIGIEPQSIIPEIYLSNDEKHKVSEIKKMLSNNKKTIIGINSTSGNSAPNLQPEEYKKIINKLLEFDNIKVVVTDYNPPAELQNINGVDYLNKGKPLRESILNFAAIDILISSSTGPMHIAAALNTKTISLFCPLTACSPKLWGPLGNISEIVLPQENYCSTVCPGDPKKCDFTGDGGINAELVVNKTINLIQ